jgi:hypothetical protein
MMTLEEYERLRERMEAEAKQEAAEADSSEPAYVSEGQRGYVSTDSEDE